MKITTKKLINKVSFHNCKNLNSHLFVSRPIGFEYGSRYFSYSYGGYISDREQPISPYCFLTDNSDSELTICNVPTLEKQKIINVVFNSVFSFIGNINSIRYRMDNQETIFKIQEIIQTFSDIPDSVEVVDFPVCNSKAIKTVVFKSLPDPLFQELVKKFGVYLLHNSY